MKNRKMLVVLLAGMFILVNTLSFISSVNIGISPANVRFVDVMRGGFAERYIVISADSDYPVEVSLSKRGDVAPWLNYEEEVFQVSRDNPYYLKISITPENDIPNGNYTGFLRVVTTSISDSVNDHAVGKIKSSLDLSIFVSITDVEYVNCFVKNAEIISAEEGEDVVLKMDILNKGNVRLNPRVLVDIWDQGQTSILQSEDFLGEVLLPTLESSFIFRINSDDLDIGQYWSDISLPECLQNVLLTFDILEEGAMKSKGVLLNILSKKEANIGEVIPFEANFKNIGEKEVEAQFKGQATFSGSVVQIFESEKMNVPVGETEGFEFYFKPEKQGAYIISGRIYYDGKKTFETSSKLFVIGNHSSSMLVVYVAFLIFVGILFYKIRKEKKLYKEKLRRLK